jgi:1,2-dihydroxy-3-keto-5-methylthiopentene dioxygenase
MSDLKVFSEKDSQHCLQHLSDKVEIGEVLASVGVRYEQWQVHRDIQEPVSQDDVSQLYADHIERLLNDEGYKTFDVIALAPDQPEKESLRLKFLDEHFHSEDEVRFFVSGSGLFSMHIDGRVYEVLCSAGDLISVPANTLHWFDMGPKPDFIAIRFFNNTEGWVAHDSGDDIATRFTRLEAK